MDIVDRIFDLLALSGISQQEFAGRISVKKNTITKWKNRELASYTKYLPQIADVLNTTTEYLLTGQGPKYREDETVVSKLDTITPADQRLLDAYRTAPPELQAAVRRVLGME